MDPTPAVEALFDDLEAELRCKICLELPKNAHTAPCNHSFCAICIDHALHQRPNCPTCNAEIRQRRLFKPDTFIDNLVDATKRLRSHLFAMMQPPATQPMSLDQVRELGELQKRIVERGNRIAQLEAELKSVVENINPNALENEVSAVNKDYQGVDQCMELERRAREVAESASLEMPVAIISPVGSAAGSGNHATTPSLELPMALTPPDGPMIAQDSMAPKYVDKNGMDEADVTHATTPVAEIAGETHAAESEEIDDPQVANSQTLNVDVVNGSRRATLDVCSRSVPLGHRPMDDESAVLGAETYVADEVQSAESEEIDDCQIANSQTLNEETVHGLAPLYRDPASVGKGVATAGGDQTTQPSVIMEEETQVPKLGEQQPVGNAEIENLQVACSLKENVHRLRPTSPEYGAVAPAAHVPKCKNPDVGDAPKEPRSDGKRSQKGGVTFSEPRRSSRSTKRRAIDGDPPADTPRVDDTSRTYKRDLTSNTAENSIFETITVTRTSEASTGPAASKETATSNTLSFASGNDSSVSGLTDPVDIEDELCCICQESDSFEENPIVFCSGCDIAVHCFCYGGLLAGGKVPKGDWFCDRCKGAKTKPVKCVACPHPFGAFKRTEDKNNRLDGKWAHVLCTLYLPETGFRDPEKLERAAGFDLINKDRIEKLKCGICKDDASRRMGAKIQCAAPRCHRAFHVTCAQVAKLHMELGDLNAIYCHMHTPGMKNSRKRSKKKRLS